mmetsp:Transcript_27224/g.34751  ORF Transcript_27224/g.34751 Transcript_27224/m.34751 type:complete len:172 (+) Transcript_27224:110-625(+)
MPCNINRKRDYPTTLTPFDRKCLHITNILCGSEAPMRKTCSKTPLHWNMVETEQQINLEKMQSILNIVSNNRKSKQHYNNHTCYNCSRTLHLDVSIERMKQIDSIESPIYGNAFETCRRCCNVPHQHRYNNTKTIPHTTTKRILTKKIDRKTHMKLIRKIVQNARIEMSQQ